MKIYLESGQFGWDYIISNSENDKTRLIQSDWDYPGIAGSFGWQACPCGMTDGTVDCEHKKVSELIGEAQKFLDSIADTNETVNDPGYFSEEN
jgi:hypothetical protein